MSEASGGREAGAGFGGPHAGGRVVRTGSPLDDAGLAVLLLHGRGGTPESMIELAESLAVPEAGLERKASRARRDPEGGGRPASSC